MKDCQFKEKFCANRIDKIIYPDPGEFSWIFTKHIAPHGKKFFVVMS